MPTPNWLAATTGQATKAAQVNQFLGAHASTLIYVGTVQSQQSTAGSGGVNSNGLYIAQTFTAGASQTAIGRIVLTVGVTGSPLPLNLSIQADSSGNPSGTPLVTTLLPADFLSGTPVLVTIPMPVSGLTSSATYHIVAAAVGDASDYYTLNKSNQTSGAQTSTNGTTWTSQAYGLLYQEFDQSTIPPVRHTWEDGGARWTRFGIDGLNRITSVWEYTAGQTAAGYMASTRTVAYTNGVVTSVS